MTGLRRPGKKLGEGSHTPPCSGEEHFFAEMVVYALFFPEDVVSLEDFEESLSLSFFCVCVFFFFSLFFFSFLLVFFFLSRFWTLFAGLAFWTLFVGQRGGG